MNEVEFIPDTLNTTKRPKQFTYTVCVYGSKDGTKTDVWNEILFKIIR